MSTDFSRDLLSWFQHSGRHDLPWQVNASPYTVWLSEIMLQQTQVATVIPYFQRFVERFPTINALATASIDEVLRYWSGLGYYARGRNLHKAAQIMVDDFDGKVPNNFEALLALPGIGRSTAGAILAQAYKQRFAILDGNIKRVLTRLHCVSGWPGQSEVQKELWQLAEHYTPQQDVANYTQAIMDLGATVCMRSKPKCQQCPVSKHCQAYANDQVSEFPERKAKKKLPTKQVNMLLLKNKADELLLEKRPPAGIWGGLMSLPEFASELAPKQWWQNSVYAELGDLENIQTCPQIKHSFSHYHLLITPIMADLKRLQKSAGSIKESNVSWHGFPNSVGLPAPVKKIIQQHISEKAL